MLSLEKRFPKLNPKLAKVDQEAEQLPKKPTPTPFGVVLLAGLLNAPQDAIWQVKKDQFGDIVPERIDDPTVLYDRKTSGWEEVDETLPKWGIIDERHVREKSGIELEGYMLSLFKKPSKEFTDKLSDWITYSNQYDFTYGHKMMYYFNEQQKTQEDYENSKNLQLLQSEWGYRLRQENPERLQRRLLWLGAGLSMLLMEDMPNKFGWMEDLTPEELKEFTLRFSGLDSNLNSLEQEQSLDEILLQIKQEVENRQRIEVNENKQLEEEIIEWKKLSREDFQLARIAKGLIPSLIQLKPYLDLLTNLEPQGLSNLSKILLNPDRHMQKICLEKLKEQAWLKQKISNIKEKEEFEKEMKKYQEKVEATNLLISIEYKIHKATDPKVELTPEELNFLYGIDRPIEGGYINLRIQEIIGKRDSLKKDLSRALGIPEKYISTTKEEALSWVLSGERMLYHYGDIEIDISDSFEEIRLPKRVKGNVSIRNSSVKRLTSPEEVGGSYELSWLHSLTKLISPKKVGRRYEVSRSNSLTKLISPEEVGGSYEVFLLHSLTELISPEEVGGSYEVSWLDSLTELISPKKVGRSFKVSRLSSLIKYTPPEEVGGSYEVFT